MAIDEKALEHALRQHQNIAANVVMVEFLKTYEAAKDVPASGGVEAVREALLGYVLKPGQYETASAFARGQNRVAIDMLGVLDEAAALAAESALAAAREEGASEATERAAKIAEDGWFSGHRSIVGQGIADDIAAAIRARAPLTFVANVE